MKRIKKNAMKRAAALFSIIVLALTSTAMTGCNKEKNSDESSVTEAVTEVAETTTEAEKATTAAATTTAHVSPIETVSFSMGSEKSDINEILDYDKNKTYKTALSEFAKPGDKLDSFVFVYYAEDGSSNISSYKGACGISVKEDCPSATDKCWYQSDDFEIDVNSAYLEVTWNVPGEIRDYVNIGDDGFIEVGYWWGGLQRLRLSSIICNYSTTAEIPVDGTKTIEPNHTLSYGSESTKKVNLPLSDMIGSDCVPQYFEFRVRGGGELQKYAGAFGITVEDSCPARTDKNWYQSKNIAVMTSSDNATLYWLVPDEIKDYISSSGEVMLGYWWSKQDSVTLESVTVKYSSSSGETQTTVTASETPKAAESEKPSADSSGVKSAKEIVDDIKIGWCLGNTLDCYNITWQVDDFETAWGNPRATKANIDAVKAAGFNAVRVPVTWNEHMNGDTIDDAWLSRVNEVIDYVIDNGMYAILNVHHDDYTWLNPSKADEANVKARLVKIWEQLSARFKNYDYHLLFEGLNEPRIIGGQDEWTCGTAEEREVINNLLAAFVETVRKSGGNNATRSLIITSHAASIDETGVNDVKIPNDDRIIVSIHYYSPWDFAGPDNDKADWGTDSDKSDLDKGFDFLKSRFIDKGIPVIIGEWGTVNKNNESVRINYADYYVRAAKQRGIKCFIWDNGPQDDFGLLNRSNNTWYFPKIVEAAVNAAK